MTDLTTPPPTPEEYQEFISGLDLVRVRLVAADMRTVVAEIEPNSVSISLVEHGNYQPDPNGFEALQTYAVRFTGPDGIELGYVGTTFGLLYSSRRIATDPDFARYFGVFHAVNLPLNAYPFMREFLHNVMGRMGWPPFTMPLHKFQTNDDPGE